MRTLCIGLLLFGSTVAYADDTLERQIKNAFLTVSAFECAAIAPNDQERERLWNLGLQHGRDFIQFWKPNSDVREATWDQIPGIWSLVIKKGPTPDFILGMLYGSIALMAGEKLSIEGEPEFSLKLMEQNRATMYREKNCAFLGKEP